MILLDFIAGAIFGVATAAFFLGRELYRLHIRSSQQKNEIERLAKLYRKINKMRDNVDQTLL